MANRTTSELHVNRLDGLRGNPYVKWDAFPAERKGSGIGASKPMGLICISHAGDCEFDSDEHIRRNVEVPSDVAKRLAKLRKGQPEDSEIRYEEFVDAIMRIQRQVMTERVLRLMNRRDYSRLELEKRLERDGYDSDIITEVLDDLSECGIVSDARFAEIYVRSKISAGWGTDRIVRELDVRGIDVKDLAGWPYDYLDPDLELERAIAAAQKKCLGSRKPNYQQLVRFLVGRGYSCNVARGAAKEVL